MGGDILGFNALNALTQDGRILMACRSMRLFSFGFLAVMLAVYLKTLGFSESQIGQVFTFTLLGDAMISLYITSRADVLGRRFMLMVGAALSTATGLIFAYSRNFWVIVVTGTLGVISPSGNEIGPFLAIEQAALTQGIRDVDRTAVFSWYNLFGSLCSAVGGLVCGSALSYLIEGSPGLSPLVAYRCAMVAYSVVNGAMLCLFACLSEAVEAPSARAKDLPVAQFLGLHRSRGTVLRLSCLFMLDSFGGAFVLQSLISNWFVLRFGTKEAVLGTIVFICHIVAGVSALFAAQLAEWIGLIMTMVVTHLPSNVLLILVPLMPTELLAIAVLCVRFSISQMDVPTRNSFVMAVVDPDERSAAGGVTNIVRSIGASTAPYLAGLLYERPARRNVPFFIAGGLKIVYDLTLLASFASVKTPEEHARAQEKAAASERTPLNNV